MPGQHNHSRSRRQSRWRLGVVSYLNARPLICGLENEAAVRICFDVPSRLTQRLLNGDFDAALIPVIDLLRDGGRLRIVSDGCIACDGETLTVRVFSRVPPDQITQIHVDLESRTSVTLARLLWPAIYRRDVKFADLDPAARPQDYETVLLIGDKVVGAELDHFRYQVDLGGAWKTWTGLPFVFAVWAAPGGTERGALHRLLGEARDRGVKKAEQIAVEFGPAHGWPAMLAQQYLRRYLQFGLNDKHVEAMIRFFDLARAHQAAAQGREMQSV